MKNALILGIIIGVFLIPSFVQGATTVGYCDTLASANETYTLNQSLVSADGSTCLSIQNDDIILDCAGFSVSNSSDGNAIFFQNDNITVKNCETFGSFTGFRVEATNSMLMDGIARNNSFGVWISGGGGLNSIDNITAYGNGQGIGIDVDNNSVTNSLVYSNNDGIDASNDYINISNTVSRSNNDDGIYVTGAFSILDNVTSYSNSGDGIDVEGDNATIMNSKSYDNEDGITMDGSSMTVDNINSSYNNQNGFSLMFYSSDSTFNNITIIGNGNQGMYFGAPETINNQLNNSYICYNSNTDIYDTDSNYGENNTCQTTYQWEDVERTPYGGCSKLCVADTSPPSITVVSPTNISYNTVTILLSVSANETINTWWYLLNSGTNITFTPNIMITATDGANNVTVWANDTWGNENSLIVYFTVDTGPPAVTIHLPENVTYGSVNVSLNVSSDEVIDTWWYSINSGTNTTFIPNTTVTSAEGANNIIVWANDTAGNENSSIVYFSIDIIVPIITITEPLNVTYTQTSITIRVSADETIDTWWYSLNSGANTTFTPNTVITIVSGSNSLIVYANDSIGNIGSAAQYFTYLSTPTGGSDIGAIVTPAVIDILDEGEPTIVEGVAVTGEVTEGITLVSLLYNPLFWIIVFIVIILLAPRIKRFG